MEKLMITTPVISHDSNCKDVGTPIMKKLDDIYVAILSSMVEWSEAILYGREIRVNVTSITVPQWI